MQFNKNKLEHLFIIGFPILLTIFANSILFFRKIYQNFGSVFLFVLLMSVFGLILILISKIKEIKNGVYFKFGPSSRKLKIIYFTGYLCIFISILVSIKLFMSIEQ